MLLRLLLLLYYLKDRRLRSARTRSYATLEVLGNKQRKMYHGIASLQASIKSLAVGLGTLQASQQRLDQRVATIATQPVAADTSGSNSRGVSDASRMSDVIQRMLEQADVKLAETKQTSADAKQASADAKQASADAKQASAEAKQASADAKHAVAEAKQASADAKQAVAEAKQASADAKQAVADAKQSRSCSDQSSSDTDEPQQVTPLADASAVVGTLIAGDAAALPAAVTKKAPGKKATKKSTLVVA